MKGEQPLEVMLIERHRHTDEAADRAESGDQNGDRRFIDILIQNIREPDDAIDAAFCDDA